MASVRDLLIVKGSRVHTIFPDATVYEATSKMNQHKLGALVVVAGDDPTRLKGIFTERDVLRRVVAQLRYPDLVQVGEVMTTDVFTATPDMDLGEVAMMFQDNRIRHLPVVDHDGRIAGMLSIGDLNAWHVSRQQATIEELSDYICGRT
jgi:CBS domain-containing protein